MTRAMRSAAVTLAILAATAAVLMAMGRPPICACGEVGLWGAVGPEQSQMLADWYSPSHVVHGILFYGALWLAARKSPIERRFAIALAVESAWEIVENTPAVIDHYRTATAALGYTGDSLVNSLSDIMMMAIGFLAARKLPVWAAIALLLVLELVPFLVIRDNLTLNVWMFLAPDPAIVEWQSLA